MIAERVVIGVEVHCENDRCPKYLRTRKRRFIGMDGGLGGRWQCANCNQWTHRSAIT
jgi:hypothetical protein